MKEHDIQNEIRLHISQLGRSVIYRGNVGQAWTGSKAVRMSDGSVTISNAHPFSTGLPLGFPDLFGFTMVEITPEMVGSSLPVFTAVEVKQPGKKPTRAQQHCLEFLQSKNCLAGIAHGVDDAENIIMRRL